MSLVLSSGWREVKPVRRMAVVTTTALLLVSTVLVGVAAAESLPCGTVITVDTKLTADIGPCVGPGIVVAGDDVTLDLGGHTITGDPLARPDQPLGPFDRDQPGILLRRVTGVTVTNGTVTGFDGGVVIMGGGSNTVRKITARDNVNYRILTGRDAFLADIDPEVGPFCWFGDGITAFNSPNNVITKNLSVGNGPFSGVSLVGNSDDNVVAQNRVEDNAVINQTPNGRPNTICGGIGQDQNAPELTGRHVQDIGVRVEGPSADRNLVEGNQIRRSGLGGIMVHGVIASFGPSNGFNVIRKNHVSETGTVGVGFDRHLHGIMLHQSGAQEMNAPHDTLIEANTSSNNLGGGIMLDARGPGLWGNVVRSNVVNNNGLDGVHVLGAGDPRGPNNLLTDNRGHGNGARAPEVNAQFPPDAQYGGTDGADTSPGCVRNTWLRNKFATVNQPCVATGGPGRVDHPGKAGAAHGAADGGPLGRGRGRP